MKLNSFDVMCSKKVGDKCKQSDERKINKMIMMENNLVFSSSSLLFCVPSGHLIQYISLPSFSNI